ncbi:DUF2244 domain-containing protein [Devosia sp. 2618]|uniref:DUF2244 domain-containing protein n=1 Tax=Devosia sp. 2618 TaxID=3156454 RepID=UPI00339805C5
MPMQATTTIPLFSAALKPDRSPRLAGGWITLTLAAIVAMPFAIVVPDTLLPIAVAFIVGTASLTMLSVRQSRLQRLTQHVTLWADQLEIASIDAKGARTLRRFDPKAVRLVLRRNENEQATAMHLRAGKEDMEIGGFLKPEDRSSFAKAFGTALRKARQAA